MKYPESFKIGKITYISKLLISQYTLFCGRIQVNIFMSLQKHLLSLGRKYKFEEAYRNKIYPKFLIEIRCKSKQQALHFIIHYSVNSPPFPLKHTVSVALPTTMCSVTLPEYVFLIAFSEPILLCVTKKFHNKPTIFGIFLCS